VSTSNEGRLFDFEVTMGALLAWVCSQHFLQQAASVLSLAVPGDVTKHSDPTLHIKGSSNKTCLVS